jgi:ribosomal protein L11 methyltransferase
MKTVALTIDVEDDLQELLIAELADLDFEAFEQEEDRLTAYVPAARWNDAAREHIEAWLAGHGLPAPLREEVIPAQNWNRQWEETIRPIVVGRFLVRPTWAEAPAGAEDRILLEIDPKMSFGTGYHESTRLALHFLPAVVRPGDRVLDAGTGTGILAIAALKLGAATAIAFDIDEWAQENAVENFYLNGVADRVTFREGSIDVVPETGFDVILANIHLSVLLEMLPAFAARLRPGGRLLLAGLLRQDRDRICTAAAHGFTLALEDAENEWWAGVWERRT